MNTTRRDLGTPNISFTPEEIELWKAEKDRLQEILGDAQQRLGAVNQLLNAAAVLAPDVFSQEVKEEPEEELDPSNLMGTLVKIVNASEKPMTKAELKEALRAAGVDPGRIEGTYFYVALNRLKKKNRIFVHPDGTIERPLKRRTLP